MRVHQGSSSAQTGINSIIQYTQRRNKWLELYVGNKLAGYCTFDYQGDVCYLWTITVKKKYQGKGFGRKLFDALLARLRNKGISQLKLTILDGAANLEMMSLIKGLPIIEHNNTSYILSI